MAQPNGAPNNGTLIRPESLDGLPGLDAQQKNLYKSGLSRLWQQYEAAAAGTPQHQQAEAKIRTASHKIMSEMGKAMRPGSGAGGAPAQQQQPQRAPSMGGQVQPQGQPAQQTQQMQQAQSSGSGQPMAQQQGQPPNPAQISPSVRQTLDGIVIHVPPNIPPQNHNQYKQKWYQSAASSLMRREQLLAGGRRVQQQITQLESTGADVPQQLRENLNTAKRSLQEIEQRWKGMRTQNDQNGQLRARAAQGQGPPQAGQQPQQQAPPGAAKSPAQDAKPANLPPNQQHRPAGAMAPNNASQQAHLGNGNAQAGQGGPQQQQPTSATQQTPQSTTQPQPPQGFPQQIQGGPGQQRPQTQMMNQQVGQTAPPQGLGPQAAQRPQPLSQQAAVAQAQEQYARGQAQAGQSNSNAAQQAVQPQVPNAMAFPPQQQSGNQGTPSSAYPQPNSMQGPTNKFPIPKQLTLDAKGQQPVPGPPSRPTLGNQGMTNQPGIVRPQPFNLEGEGDHVLSKRKLDELMRQVIGSSDISPENGGLTPEAEEHVLKIADDFVDNVITQACRMAKLRAGQTLEIKDIQLVLERHYGIRIPGYTLDEPRTVRKFQPAPGWQSKMQAIQTAKTLGGVNKGNDS